MESSRHKIDNTAVWNLLSNLLQQLRVSQPCVHMALSCRVYKESREIVPLMEQPKSPMAGAQEGWTGHETGGVERAHCCSTFIMMMTATTRCGSSNTVATAASQKEMVQEGVAHPWCCWCWWCGCVGHAGGASHQCLWRPSHCRPTHSASSTPVPLP